MTIAEWCLLGAVLLYLLTIAPVKPLGYRDFDNSYPRDPAFYRPGLRARALGAHLNGIETFPFFAVAVLLAEFRHSSQGWIDALAVAFVAVRLVYVLLYLGNRPWLRTLTWNVGFAVNLAIFLLPLIGSRLPPL
ncbi:MAG TPA: MAPEG family protein [Rhizomicrobium sp.]|nr:MAPEG family protein [Rhizomicrobium sp.]